jgi:two-component system OmpR family response regulator
VLTQLRRKKHTPVLLLTACDTPEDRVLGLDRGADDFLTKPFEISELLARIRALIRRTAGIGASRIDVAGFVIDLAAREVSRDGQTVQLTAKEFALLEYLALHRGKVLTRNQICDHIFDERNDSLSNLVDVHVFNIRKKVGRDLIVTRRGMGYLIPA